MKQFTFFGCVATLLLASSLPWEHCLAANAPNTPTPIDAEWMEGVEDITWKFAERNRHTIYSQVWNQNGGYYGTCMQEAYFVLPDAQTESIWFKVRVTENPGGIQLSTQNKSNYFDSGELWIPTEECPREEGSMEQMVPIRAEAYGSGNCTFVIEAYKSQSDVTPIDSFTTSVQFYMNMPTARLPFLINRSDATLNITTGDLSGIEAYVDLQIWKQSGLGVIGWYDDSREITPESENHWKGTLQALSDRTLTTHFSFQQEGSAEYLLYLMDAAGDPICMQAGTIVYPFKPSSKDSTTIAKWAVQNPENKSIADFISSGAWKEDREYEQNGSTIGVKWDTYTPSHVTDLFITRQTNSLQQLNLAGLDSLQRLTLNGNNFLSQLEGLTDMPKLERIVLYGSALGYTSIDFPAHFDKANITGISNLRGFGTTRSDNYTEEVASGTTIDVSSYAQSVDGYETTCSWSKTGSFVSNEPVYTLEGAPGDVFKCEFHNAAFPNWNVQTVEIYIVKTFAADDVATLEAIVNGSTSTSFKQWYNKGLWQESGEVTLGDGHWISIYWSDSGRLQTLSMPFWEEALPSTIDLSALDELSSLDLSFNNIESLTLPTNPEKLTSLQVASNPLTSLDITKCVNLQLLNVGQTAMHFSDIINPHPLTEVRGQTRLKLADKYFVDRQGHIVNSFVTTPAYVNFSKDLQVGEVPSVITWEALIDNTYQPITLTANAGVYAMSDAFKYSNRVRATITNEMCPGWNITLDAQPYTKEGDANFDREVNVQDISATTAYILADEANILPTFGFCQADVDQSKEINISDVVAMVKIINGQPSSLKSIFHPTVFVTSEADGRLYIDAPVEVAGLQLTIAGASQAIPLLGEAANLTQVSVVKDSVRTLAYSLSGKTIPAGRTLLAQLPKGAKVVEATFADAQANLLLSDLTGSATATEDPMPQVTVTQVSNYPNPFRGQTTFTYGLGEQADEAVLRVYQANGALVHLSKELPAAQGENQYTTSIDLPAGIYYYQLIIQRAGRTIHTMSNNFIIK